MEHTYLISISQFGGGWCVRKTEAVGIGSSRAHQLRRKVGVRDTVPVFEMEGGVSRKPGLLQLSLEQSVEHFD